MMSRTCISETCSAPSIIDRASPSRRFLAKAECNSLSSLLPVLGLAHEQRGKPFK